MRRNHEIKVRLNDDEFNDLNRKVIKSKLSREEYIRRCFSKSLIKEPPDLDYFRLKNEFNHIGNNLNQIAKYFNTGGESSAEMKDEIRQCISDLFSLRKEVLRMAGELHGHNQTH